MTNQKTPAQRARDLWDKSRQEGAARYGVAHKPWDQLSSETQQVLILVVTRNDE